MLMLGDDVDDSLCAPEELIVPDGESDCVERTVAVPPTPWLTVPRALARDVRLETPVLLLLPLLV